MLSFVIVSVHLAGQDNLPHVAGAFDRLRLLLGFGQGRKEQSGQDGDDGNHDQQFDQSKGAGDFRNVFHARGRFHRRSRICFRDCQFIGSPV